MKIALDKIEIVVSKSLFGKVNVEFNGQAISVNDTKARVIEIIQDNYKKIKAHYFSNLSKYQLSDFDSIDLNTISVKILIYYLDQYSRWKEQYKKSNYDINFMKKILNTQAPTI